jgi:isopentenyl-diphosphate delta-isomerase
MAQNPSSTRYVVAIDERGQPRDPMSLRLAHEPPGTLHRAVSVQLVNRSGGWLVQRRASAKALFAGRWANSCCTHPGPGESLEACARRRVFDELGITAGPLTPAGWFTYRAVDPVSGLVEHERDHVFVGMVDDNVAEPDPAEVAEVAWSGLQEASHLLAGPLGAPWAGSVLALGSMAFRYGIGEDPYLGEAS